MTNEDYDFDLPEDIIELIKPIAEVCERAVNSQYDYDGFDWDEAIVEVSKESLIQARKEALDEAIAWIESNMFNEELFWHKGPAPEFFGGFDLTRFKSAFASAMWRPEREQS